MPSFMTRTSFRNALSQLMLLPVVAMAILASILALQIHSLESSAAWVDHTDLVIARMNELTRLMIDEETGVRGYLLTGRDEFLEPYSRAQREIGPHFRELQQLVEDNPSQVERLRKLSAQNDAWEEFATRRLRAQRTQEQLIAESLASKASMDQIRGEAARFINTERALRARRFADALFRSRIAHILPPVLAVLAAALIFIFTRRLFRKIARIQVQHEWLNTTLRGIGDPVIACDPEGRVVFMNGLAEALTGWTENDARGRPLPEVFHIVNEETRGVVESPVGKVLRLGAAVASTNHTVLVRKDGFEIAIDDRGAPNLDAQGSLIGVVMVFHDVSERRNMERALQQTEAESRARTAELEAIMQVVPAGIFVAHDPKCERVTRSLLTYELLRLQPGAKRSKSIPAGERPRNFRAMKNGRELTLAELPLQVAAATGREIRDFELMLAFNDGSSRDMSGYAAPLFDESGAVRGAVAAFIDITDRKRAEEALRKTEKLAFAGRMAASLSHEINNPLEAVTDALYLLQRASSLEQVREFATIAQEELARVSAIANQTLRFSRQSSRPNKVEVAKLLDSVLSLYERRFSSSGISVERQYEGSASLYACDGELHQVFVNVMANAFDATRNVGTKLVVRERQALDWKTGCKGIRITVADTGHGMDKETLKRIFEPFFSTKGETVTGLGLWITKEIIEKHCGSVRVRSSQQPQRRGTVFSIFFPLECIPLGNQQSHAASTTA
jgi:PAS domain S-box-containing protein